MIKLLQYCCVLLLSFWCGVFYTTICHVNSLLIKYTCFLQYLHLTYHTVLLFVDSNFLPLFCIYIIIYTYTLATVLFVAINKVNSNHQLSVRLGLHRNFLYTFCEIQIQMCPTMLFLVAQHNPRWVTCTGSWQYPASVPLQPVIGYSYHMSMWTRSTETSGPHELSERKRWGISKYDFFCYCTPFLKIK